MDEGKQRPKGGARPGAGAKSTWQTPGKTKLVRVPEKIAAEVLEAARAIDAGYHLTRGRKDLSRIRTSGWILKHKNGPDLYRRKTYFNHRYHWYEGRQIRSIGIPKGNSCPESGRSNLQLVEQAISQAKSPIEIVQMIESWKNRPQA